MRHRLSSHGFSLNVTQEPLDWFNLVTACGLTNVRATSIDKMRSETAQPMSVQSVAEDLMPFFASKLGRNVVPLSALRRENAAAETIARLVECAETQAATEEDKAGGWPSKPRPPAEMGNS